MQKALQAIEQRAELRRVTRNKAKAIHHEASKIYAVGASTEHSVEVELGDDDRPVEMARQRSAEAISALEKSRQRINELETELKQLESSEAAWKIFIGVVVVVVLIVLVAKA